MNRDKFLELIEKRKEVLLKTKERLKSKFVGIDKVIDNFIESVTIWYLMPELQTRPLIVCLWGQTGTGKTDLVRTFVRELEMTSSFVEIQMDTTRSSFDKVENHLSSLSVEPNEPAVLLLDEFQRFRTKAPDNKDVDNKGMQDIWMLLSDGRFQPDVNKKNEMLSYLYEWDDDDDKDDDEETKKKKQYNRTFWSAMYIKKILRVKESIESIMQWDKETRNKAIIEALNNANTFEGNVYSKLLVVVSGNLDEAYTMADEVADADNDADVYHEFSKSINVISIKEALQKRFKPEQIARLGNIHHIYPSLSKANYQKIIEMRIDKLVLDVKEKYGLKVNVDNSINDVIYANGVFPTQGVRPVLSTISSLFENYLPGFIFNAIKENKKEFRIYFDGKYLRSNLHGDDGVDIKYEINLMLDDIKKSRTEDLSTLSAVHEAGHAVLYAVLRGLAPTQIKSSTSGINYGFISKHRTMDSRKSILEDIRVMLGGRVAEEMVFGEHLTSEGSSHDIIKATRYAVRYVRHLGFSDFSSFITIEADNEAVTANTDVEITNPNIENLIKNQKQLAATLLEKHKEFYVETVNRLLENGEIKQKDFKELAANYGIKIKILSSKEQVSEEYSNLWSKFNKKSNE